MHKSVPTIPDNSNFTVFARDKFVNNSPNGRYSEEVE